MNWAIEILTAIIAILHVYFLYFEMFAWETVGRKVFHKYPKEFFSKTKVLATNQGIYNGFLAAGLIWSIFIKDQIWQDYVGLFFLSCVLIAGIVGAVSADRKIFYIQGIPALITIILILIERQM